MTIEDLLTGKTIDRPPAQTSVTFKKAPKAKGKAAANGALDFVNEVVEGPQEDEPVSSRLRCYDGKNFKTPYPRFSSAS